MERCVAAMPGLSTFFAVTNSLMRNGAAPVALSLSGEWPSLPPSKERVFHICEQAPGNPVREVRVDGGSVALVNGFGRGENTYGSAISASREAPPSPYAFATIPLQTIPMYAGFELTLKVRPTDVSRPAWNTVKVFFDQHEAWIEVNGTRGERKQFSGWQFGPTIGGLGVMPWKTDYYPGEFGALSVRLR